MAGATGAIGRQLLPMLIAAGYEVSGTTRNLEKAGSMETIGVRPVVVDAYDRDALIAAVGEAKPDVIVHQLTDLSTADFAATTRLRIEGTRNLVDAAMAVGVRRMIAQNLAIVYAPGEGPASEEDPLADDLPAQRDTVRGCARSRRLWVNSPKGWFCVTGCSTDQAPGIRGAVPSPMRCNAASDSPVTGSVRSSMWKMPRGRHCSRSIGRRGSSISSTTTGRRNAVVAAFRRHPSGATAAAGRTRWRERARRIELEGATAPGLGTAPPDLARWVPDGARLRASFRLN